MARERGRLHDRFPFVTFGSGTRTLLAITGVSDAFWPDTPTRFAAFLLERYYYRRFRETHTCYVVGRKRGLPDGYTTADMAADYAGVVSDLDPPVDVHAVSLGGLIAQHLAIDNPDLVRRLVLGVTGCRLGDAGRRTIERWVDWADRGQWFDVARDSVAVTYTDYRRYLYPSIMRATRGVGTSEPADAGDVAVSGRAALAHDTTDRLGDIEAPTLVIGGTHDHFFPEEIQRETAERIPGARLELLSGTGHAAFEERKWAFDATVAAFLD